MINLAVLGTVNKCCRQSGNDRVAPSHCVFGYVKQSSSLSLLARKKDFYYHRSTILSEISPQV